MKRIFFAAAVFFVAAVLGFGVSLFTTPAATAGPVCMPAPRAYIWHSRDTGPQCSEPTPYKVYACDGLIVGAPGWCDCEWIGCSSYCL